MTYTAPHARSSNRTMGPQLMTDTAGAYQYGVHVTSPGVAGGLAFRRNLSTGAIQTFDLSTITGNPLSLPIEIESDDHYALSVGIDDQNVVHISGNDHDLATSVHRYVTCTNVAAFTTAGSWQSGGSPFNALGTGGGAYTYNLLERTSAGVLLWFLSQSESASASIGRDWLGFKRVAGAWVAIVSDGHFMTTEAVTDGTANRCYICGLYVEPDGGGAGVDRVHVSGIWRTADADADSQKEPWYLYSDNLTTWKNIDGTTHTMPITWANRATASITSAPAISALYCQGIGIDNNGYPHMVFRDGTLAATETYDDCYWNGTAWAVTPDISNQPSALHRIKGGLWLRRKSTGTANRIILTNQTTGAVARIGNAVGSCTPNPDPIRLREQDIYSVLIGDGDTPIVWEFGNGSRASAA